MAKKAHAHQKRSSGAPYIEHPLAVAKLLLQLKPDEDSIVVALLHDVLEDTDYTLEELIQEFDSEIAPLLTGLEKLENVYYRGQERQIENLRKMFLAMANDIRVILIKLVDRLHNMQTLEYVREDKQRRIAQETLSIYCPIAGRLGIYTLKQALEDLCFRYLQPHEYDRLANEIKSITKTQEKILKKSKFVLERALRKAHIDAKIEGRIKNFYSIYRKLKRKQKDHAWELYDIIALRVIVKNEGQCYQALGTIHKNWSPLSHRFKDYIAKAKPNGYQSLHTTVVGLSKELMNQPIEIQIRTDEMNHIAHYGVAAHWQYKEQAGKPVALSEEKIDWIKNLVDLHENLKNNNEFIESLNVDIFSDRIFVLTPKGDVIDLPKDATPIDFAYSVHTDVGHRCKGAKVDGRIVPLSYKLQSGEVVEILTQNINQPNRYWLSFVVSSHAKSSIKQWFNAQEREQLLKAGKDLVNKQLRRFNQPILSNDLSFLQRYNNKKLSNREREDLLERIGNGSIDALSVVKKILPTEKVLKKASQEEMNKQMLKEVVNLENAQVLITGERGYKTQMATCCQPNTSDRIIGYITRGRGITIHKEGCKVVKNHEKNRLVRANWASKKAPNYKVTLQIKHLSRIGMLRDVASVFAENETAILDFEHVHKKGLFVITFSLDTLDTLDKIIGQLEVIPDVFGVKEA